MSELDLIAEALRRQRKDLDELVENTSARREETSGLITKLEELRRRSEETQRKLTTVDGVTAPETTSEEE